VLLRFRIGRNALRIASVEDGAEQGGPEALALRARIGGEQGQIPVGFDKMSPLHFVQESGSGATIAQPQKQTRRPQVASQPAPW
jgi:hypothetical protein